MLETSRIKILETKAQREAREILGEQNFQGLDVAMAFFSPYSLDVLEGSQFRMQLRLRSPDSKQLLWETDSLRLITRCRKTHFVVATQPLNLLQIIERQPDSFSPQMRGDRCWLRAKCERHWSACCIKDPWLLVPKDPTRLKSERTSVVDYVYAAILTHLATGLPPFGRDQKFPFSLLKDSGSAVYAEWYAGGLLLG